MKIGRLKTSGRWLMKSVFLCLIIWGCNGHSQSQGGGGRVDRLDLLVKHPDARKQVEINEAGVAIYASVADRTAGKAETRIYPDEYELTKQLFSHLTPAEILPYYLRKGLDRWPDTLVKIGQIPKADFYFLEGTAKPLTGLRIAIDPGHISGDLEMAELEGKYVKMRASRTDGRKAIAFFEPYLTMITALLVRDQLEAMGATVLLTKAEPGKSVFGQPFGLWHNNSLDSTLKAERAEGNLSARQVTHYQQRATLAELFSKFYNRADLRARAKKINDFHPDLTLIIHYNIHSPNWDKRDTEGFFTPTDANYSMAFTPGAFYRGELAEPIDRLSLLRCILTDDVPRSKALCDEFIRTSEQYTGVKPVEANSDLPYLKKYSVFTGAPGVFARNLFLTRRVWGPMCYGESLCQDNEQEAFLLSQRDMDVHGYVAPRRLAEVADAYVMAVMRYASTFTQ